MKKILFATTALVATASVAAADVSFSGYGRFGVRYNDATGASTITTRYRLQIVSEIEADNGLTFGARVRIQQTTNGAAPGAAGINGARFYVKSGGLEVGVGNIYGAIEWMPGMYIGSKSASIGLTGLGFQHLVTNTDAQGYFNWDAYSSAGGGRHGVEVRYSAGSFGGHLSYSSTGGTERTGLNLSYSFSDWTVGLGYQDSNVAGEDKLVLTVGGKIGPAKVGFAVADNEGTLKYGLTGQFEVGSATRVDAFISSEDGAGESYGLGVSHNLGGGASIEAGVVNGTTGVTQADLGLHFSF